MIKILNRPDVVLKTCYSLNLKRSFSLARCDLQVIKDYYSVLNIPQNASRREIKQSYYRLSKEFHPDVNTQVDAENRFKEIQEAYQILGDENMKAEYDESLNSGGYYDAQDQSSNVHTTFRQWKRRPAPNHGDSSTFTGKTPTYDFEEYFRAHYSEKRPRSPFSSSASSSNSMKSKEELKMYWQKKEADNLNDSLNVHTYLNKIVWTLGLFGFVYIFMRYLKTEEDKNNIKTQQRLVNEKKI